MGFRTSSYCDTASCMEIDVGWHKSTHSATVNCITVYEGSTVRVRDSKDPASPVLGFSPAAWTVFTGWLRP